MSPAPDPAPGLKLPLYIGAREAELILGVARTTLHELAQSGRLPGRLVDLRGPARWQFKRSDVLKLKASGRQRKHKQRSRKQLELWRHYFGPIPDGLTAAFRDHDRSNVSPQNLCLVPLRKTRRAASKPREATTTSAKKLCWTVEMKAQVRRKFPVTVTDELARELGVSSASLRRQARRMRLRKNRQFISAQSKVANRLPIGSERLHDSTGSMWVKVSHAGERHCERWRPKQHVIWEELAGRPVPDNHCVIFKDGNKLNFDPSNLELISRREMSARGFARFISYPEPLQKAIKLTSRLDRDIARRRKGEAVPPRAVRRGCAQGPPREWTAAMDRTLRRQYPVRPISEILVRLGVTESSLRQRARRLKVRRLPETIIREAREAARQAHG